MRIEELDINKFDKIKTEVSVGQKSELQEIVNRFNRDYGKGVWNTNTREMDVINPILGYTSKLMLKRGSYDRIKMAYNEKILDFGTRTNSLHTLSNKIQNSGYQSRRFYTQLRKIL